MTRNRNWHPGAMPGGTLAISFADRMPLCVQRSLGFLHGLYNEVRRKESLAPAPTVETPRFQPI